MLSHNQVALHDNRGDDAVGDFNLSGFLWTLIKNGVRDDGTP